MPQTTGCIRKVVGILRIVGALALAIHFAGPALAQPTDGEGGATVLIDMPAEPLGDALTALATKTGLMIGVDAALIAGKQAPALNGRYTPEEALRLLLEGSGLAAISTGNAAYTVAPAPDGAMQELPEVKVRGTQDRTQPYAGGQVARDVQVGMLGDLKVMDAPFSITGYTAQTVQDQQARTLADVMANDPSVRNFLSQTFPGDEFYIRGFQAGSSDFSLDGLYGVLPYLRLSPVMAERIDVQKGPTAMLNGMPPFGSVGGTINVVPKRAGSRPLTQLTATFASDAQLGAHLDIGRRFGPGQNFGIRFNGLYRSGGTAVDENSQEFGLAAIGFDYSGTRVRFSVDLGYQQQNEDGIENGLFGVTGTDVPDPPDASSRYFQPWLYHDNHDTFGALRGEVDLTSSLTAFAAVGGRRHSYEELYSYGFPLDVAGNFDQYFGYGAAYADSSTVQAGLRGRFETGAVRHQVTVNAGTVSQERGVLYFFDAASGGVDPILGSNIYAPTFVAAPSLAPLPGDIPKINETDLTSVGLADVLSMMDDRVTVVMGARWQQVKVDDQDSATPNYDESAISPGFGLVVKPRGNISVYGNVIQGLSQGPTAPSGTTNAGEVFPPSKSMQYEAGVKVDSGRVGTTLAVFQIEKPSETTDATNTFNVDGKQRNRGIEASVFGEPAPGVRVLGGAMFLDGTLVKTDGGLNDGNTATDAGDINLNLGGEWDTPFVRDLTVTARALYTSSVYIDAANTQQIPSWTRVDAGARYALRAGDRPVVLRASVENLFDQNYWVNSSLFRGAPRTFLVSATVDF
ncbi:MAG: TonB-dependent siderophore receptor [Nitrospirota bacterium]